MIDENILQQVCKSNGDCSVAGDIEHTKAISNRVEKRDFGVAPTW